MNILLSNDDGILAPGLAAMYRALAGLGTVTVAAPDSVQSATAHAITVAQAIPVRRIRVHHEFDGWSVGGRPADCVKLAVHTLCGWPPDLVVSGINDGANVSINVLYSGTVAAAAEGALLGLPAVAVSLASGPEVDFDRAGVIARRVLDALLRGGLAPGKLVNVNIPTLRPGWPKGVRVAEQSLQVMEDRYECMEGVDGVRHYTLNGDFAEPQVRETDLHALMNGYVTVTPLHVDLTDRSRMGELSSVDWPTFDNCK